MLLIDIKLFLLLHHFMLNHFHVMIIVLILDNFYIIGDGHGNLKELMKLSNEIFINFIIL